jgi:hypothetical protein
MMAAKKSRIGSVAFLAITICLFSFPAYAKYSGGIGEPNDPYQIATAADLIALGDSPGDYGKHFILTADIDLDPNLPGRKVFDKAVIAPDTDPNDSPWSELQGTPFTGVFDGKGHTISRLTIDGGSYLGLFGELSGEVVNLAVVDVNVTGTGNYVGGLVGYNSGGTVTRCYTTGVVGGAGWNVGGLAGLNLGLMTNCYSTGTVSGGGGVGGLVGGNSGSITASYSTGTVSGQSEVGGLVGNNTQGVLTQCYSTGVVGGSGEYVGGLVGINGSAEVFKIPPPHGFVTDCLWDTQTSGQAMSDGGIGKTTAEMQDINTFLNAGWDFVDEVLNGTCDYWQISPGDYPRLRCHAGDGPVMPEGLGTAEQPYLIRDARDLGTVWFEPMAHYRLEASVDLSGINWSMAVIPCFGGTFDGNGYVISNLHIQGAGYLGLFGQLGSTASVSNLDLEAVAVNGVGPRVGGLVGTNGSYNREGGVLTNCSSTGVVSVISATAGSVGGLVGANNGTVTRCCSTCAVSGNSSVGGLVGGNNGSITASYSTGAISGGNSVGGLVGMSSDGSITECYSNGSVSGTYYHASAGGLVGANYRGAVTQCYSAGTVSGTYQVGGLVGVNWWGTVTQCYSTGSVSGTGQSLWNVGGLVGDTYESSMIACFWDTETSGQTTSHGGTGKTTAEMQTASTFLDVGWDFVGETANGSEDIWKIMEGLGYPRLSWQRYSGGTGEPNNPYQIATAADLIALGEDPNDYDKHFILTADIDLDPNLPGRKVFDKAVIAPDTKPNDEYDSFQGTAFSGVFDGDGHTISHLRILGQSDYLGLFGLLEFGGEIKDLGVANVEITASGGYVGGLVGGNGSWESYGGTVTQCYSSGSVSGTGSVGGLVGYNSGGSISSSYSTGVVRGDEAVGGLVGSHGGILTNCYSTGAVSGTGDYVGGLVGCGSTSYVSETKIGSPIGRVKSCFWDIQTSGQSMSDGGTGKTTVEMQTASTFLGWGCRPAIWTIDEGVDYPRLAWESKPGKALTALADFIIGSGSPGDPYLIGTPDDLNTIGLFPLEWDKHFSLMANIDMSSFDGKNGRSAFNVIGTESRAFTGVFDGDGHTIAHLTVKGVGYAGLFGVLGGEVRDLGVVDVNISGSGDRVGGLVGYNAGGDVIRCHGTGTVSGGGNVGGLVGYNSYGSVTQCYSTASVTGSNAVGGLVGSTSTYYSNSLLTRCYSTGAVSGAGQDVGGLVGSASAKNVTACFWDIQASGQATSAGGTGLTTAEMQTASAFLEAGWDFVGETANGTEDIWWILEGQDYPRLWWELIPGN